MVESKHTPPPWTVRDLAVWSIKGKVLDSVSGDLDQIEADLQLAAAAPDLLAALKKLVSDANHISRPDQWHQLNDATIQACAAIAKARGEPQ